MIAQGENRTLTARLCMEGCIRQWARLWEKCHDYGWSKHRKTVNLSGWVIHPEPSHCHLMKFMHDRI